MLMLLVRVMTCWKEKGGVLFGHGSFNLTDRQTGDQTDREGQKGGRKGELSLTIRQTNNQIDELMERKSD